MSLFVPETGLIFWMLLSFGIVMLILAKYGFPVITKMVEERKQYIDRSLLNAKEANEQLLHLKAEAESILTQAHEAEKEILKQASESRRSILLEARNQARMEGEKMLDEVRKQIQAEKEDAICDIRRQIAILSVDIAEKVLRTKLDTDAKQMQVIDRMVDELTDVSKN